MAQFIVRNLEDEVRNRLQKRARAHGRSMEEEVRHILRDAVRDEVAASPLGSRIARRFAGIGLTGELPRMQGELKPADFGE
jgi:plasmid stability protein